MAVLAADKLRERKALDKSVIGEETVADSTTIYMGALLCANASGKIVNGAIGANLKFVGVAVESMVTGASNTKKIRYEYGIEEWFPSALGAATIGTNGYLSDNNTIAATATNAPLVGRITGLETKAGVAGVWVALGSFAGPSGT